jgi:5'-deoxynucleotidase YfbR-like HD superfamily hydrolase
MRAGDFMQTYTGQTFWPLDPRPDEIHVEDIAHALSMQCRFAGHVNRFYSVAEHSVLMWTRATKANALWALLHDASEAYLSDIVRPIKNNLSGYKTIEIGLMGAVAERFGLASEMPDEVKSLDNRILMDERAQLMRLTPEVWNFCGETQPLGVTIQGLSPAEAKRAFIEAFDVSMGWAA